VADFEQDDRGADTKNQAAESGSMGARLMRASAAAATAKHTLIAVYPINRGDAHRAASSPQDRGDQRQ